MENCWIKTSSDDMLFPIVLIYSLQDDVDLINVFFLCMMNRVCNHKHFTVATDPLVQPLQNNFHVSVGSVCTNTYHPAGFWYQIHEEARIRYRTVRAVDNGTINRSERFCRV